MTTIAIRPFAEADYQLACEWWKGHDWNPIPRAALPKTGRVALLLGRPVAVGWIYQTDSVIAHLEWIVRDPSILPADAAAPLAALIDSLCSAARNFGAQLVYTTARNASLLAKLKDAGFEVMEDRTMTCMLRKL